MRPSGQLAREISGQPPFHPRRRQSCDCLVLPQEQLIQQLREQHYEQYMSQVYARQAEVQAATLEGQFQTDGAAPAPVGVAPLTVTRVTAEDDSDSEAGSKPKDAWMQKGLERPTGAGEGEEDEEDSDSDAVHEDVPSNPKIAPASTWSRKDIAEFKEAIKKEGQEGIIKVGHGETVTVRVPTHEDGTCLFWEFATDYYDIGFGVYFEWSISETSEVSVHVSESSDEEYEEDAEGSGTPAPAAGDVEGGSTTRVKQRDPNKPAIDEIIPVYRRDAHEEVLAGSHVYPARGVYLLKFDNTYSLWRSKTLYYRVYYSK
uniref:GOLD domain-containing protein n=1 Tax=Panagrellus redivivus TaxID=6233 RepID=A0A7E4VTI7_PANRE